MLSKKSFQGKLYKKGGQKKNVKCLCKNGQNGDQEWKKSCSWSFKEVPLSASDVKTVQCKARTDQSTTTTTTSTTTTSTTTSTTTTTTTMTPSQVNPNTHRFCEMRNTWIPCSNCYSYVETEEKFFNIQTSKWYDSSHTCTYSISTKCNPDFKDRLGHTCNDNASMCRGGGFAWYLDIGIMTDEGFMTAFNCPQCGCTEENGPIRPNFQCLKFGSLYNSCV